MPIYLFISSRGLKGLRIICRVIWDIIPRARFVLVTVHCLKVMMSVPFTRPFWRVARESLQVKGVVSCLVFGICSCEGRFNSKPFTTILSAYHVFNLFNKGECLDEVMNLNGESEGEL